MKKYTYANLELLQDFLSVFKRILCKRPVFNVFSLLSYVHLLKLYTCSSACIYLLILESPLMEIFTSNQFWRNGNPASSMKLHPLVHSALMVSKIAEPTLRQSPGYLLTNIWLKVSFHILEFPWKRMNIFILSLNILEFWYSMSLKKGKNILETPWMCLNLNSEKLWQPCSIK